MGRFAWNYHKRLYVGNVKIGNLSIGFIIESKCSPKQATKCNSYSISFSWFHHLLFLGLQQCSYQQFEIVEVSDSSSFSKIISIIFCFTFDLGNLAHKFGCCLAILKRQILGSFILRFFNVNQRYQLLVVLIFSEHLVNWFLLFLLCLLMSSTFHIQSELLYPTFFIFNDCVCYFVFR